MIPILEVDIRSLIAYYDSDLLPGSPGGYNIGDLLNMPFIMGEWNQNPHNNQRNLTSALFVAYKRPDSIVGMYFENRPSDEKIPNTARLRSVVHRKIDLCLSDKDREFFRRDDVLCIHLRLGDRGEIPDMFLSKILSVSSKYQDVVFFTGIHLDKRFQSIAQSVENTRRSFAKIHSLIPHAKVMTGDADTHLCLLTIAKNVLLHFGGFTLLVSIARDEPFFYTDDIDRLYNISTGYRWKSIVGDNAVYV
jgi:hypothetical protein